MVYAQLPAVRNEGLFFVNKNDLTVAVKPVSAGINTGTGNNFAAVEESLAVNKSHTRINNCLLFSRMCNRTRYLTQRKYRCLRKVYP